MIVSMTTTKVVATCDVARCDSGNGPLQERREGPDSLALERELSDGGWVFGLFAACPGCCKWMDENRLKRSPESTGPTE